MFVEAAGMDGSQDWPQADELEEKRWYLVSQAQTGSGTCLPVARFSQWSMLAFLR